MLKQPGKRLGDDEYAFFCPRHGARPDRTVGQLGVNVATDKFHCYSCGFGGKTLLFLFPHGSQEWKEYKESLPDFKPEVKKKEFEDVVLPEGFRSLSFEWKSPYYSAAVRYLNERGLGRREILKWKLGYSEDGSYRNRIIVPSFDEFGHLNFLTGRAIYDGMDRYWNGRYCKDIIFNDYMIDWRKPVVITEGPFDAFKVDTNAIALLGSLFNVGTRLFSKVVLSGVDVFMALDADARDKQFNLIKELLSYGVKCLVVPLGKRKDVGEMTKEEFQDAKRSSIAVENEGQLLKMRMRV